MFLCEVMSFLLNMLSRFVSFPSTEPESFNFIPGVIACSEFGAQENKLSLFSLTVSTFLHFICHEVMGPDAMILVFKTLF